MRNKIIAMLFAALFCFTGAAVHAQVAETITVTPTPKTRTISTEGNGHVVDNINDTDSEKLQFITVTAKDGSVFYVVIDKQNSNDNVYFLNSVDVSDLEALTEDYKTKAAAVSTPSPTPAPSADQSAEPEEKKETPKKNDGINSGLLIVILILAAAGIGGGYYIKVLLPKKQLEDADDLDDFDFEDENEDENGDTDYDADEYGEDDTEDEDE